MAKNKKSNNKKKKNKKKNNKKKKNKKDILNNRQYKETKYYKNYLNNIKELAINLKKNGYYTFRKNIYKFNVVTRRFTFSSNAVWQLIKEDNPYQDIPLTFDVKNIIINELTAIPNPQIYNTFQYAKIPVPEEHKTDFEALKETLLTDGLIKEKDRGDNDISENR